MIKQKKGFTFVELIVSIMILTILGTISVISIQGYGVKSRDSRRIGDLEVMNTGLGLFYLESGKYPEPTGGVSITYSGGIVWIQGTFGSNVKENISNLNIKPVDPLTGREYTYSVLNTKMEYELGCSLEGDYIVLNNDTIQKANANGTEKGTAYVNGKYNGQVAKMLIGTDVHILAIPSLISSDISDINLLNIINNKKLVYKGYTNLPSSYLGTKFNVNGESNLNLVNSDYLLVYTGATIPKTTEQIITFVTNLKQAYSGTILENNSKYKSIITVDINDSAAVSSLGTMIIDRSLRLR